MRHLIAALLVTLFVWTGARAQGVVNGDAGRDLDLLIQRSLLGQFWGAVLVAKDGQILLAKGYGVANTELAPMSSRSLLDIGSVAKCFTAAAVVKLEQQGKLSLDDPITKFYPDAPEDKKPVTLKHLLGHTAGLAQNAPTAWSAGDERDTIMNALLAAPSKRPPGESFEYSNAGYFILAAVVEKASGTSWEKYLTEQLLRPAGMKDSGCCGDTTLAPDLLTARQARDWSIDGDAASWPYPLTWGYRGAGGVVSSVSDMYAWDRALRTDALLDAPARQKLFEPGLNQYALGWEVKASAAGRVASHSGSVRGYLSVITRWLDRDACVVVLTNERHNPIALSRQLSEKLFAELAEETALLVNTAGQQRTEFGMIKFPAASTIACARAGAGATAKLDVVVRTPGREEPAIKVTMSPSAATAFAQKLALAIDGVKSRGADPSTKGVEAEAYTAVYKLEGDEPLQRDGEGVSLDAQAGTMHAEPGGTKKVLVFAKDDKRGMLPVFLKLGMGTAQELLDSLRKLLAE